MKFTLKLSFIILIILPIHLFASDFEIRSTINKDNDPVAAYNSVDDEYLVVWTEYSNVSIEVLGQRMKADGTGSIGSAFVISTIGAFPSVSYNPQSNDYLVTFSLSGNIIGRRVSNVGTLVGSPVTYISKTNSIYSRVIYNELANNYLLFAGELTDLGNDQSNIKIHSIKISVDGQPAGTEKLIRDQGHGNYSDGARFAIAYAPIVSTETPTGRFLLAIKDPTDLTMLDENGTIVSKVNDSQHPGNIVDDHIPFQQSKIGISHNVDVAFGNFEGENIFMVVWGDRDNQYQSQSWSGIWAGIVNATQIEYESDDGVSSNVFPVSAIFEHSIDNLSFKSWKPVIAYNKAAYKFMVAWRETPTNASGNDTKVNHIRANTVYSSLPPVSLNVVLSAVTGTEDPMGPAIAVSEKSPNALVAWEDSRNISTNDIDLYGNIWSTTSEKSLVLESPNGNEVWVVGTQQEISWKSEGIGSVEVKIEYSTDYGATFNLINFQTNTDGSNIYNWTVPNTPSTQCLVKISAGGLSDYSDLVFTINEPPRITIVEPNGGESWIAGEQQQIKWESANVGSYDVQLEYSTDNGTTYKFIDFVTNIDGLNTYNWEVPNTPSNQCLVKVSVLGISDNSDAIFTITGIPKITVDSPNGGEVFISNIIPQELMEIKWISKNFDNPVRIDIEYFTQNLKWSRVIAENTPNDGSYETVYWGPNNLYYPKIMQARIRVADANKNAPGEPEDGKIYDWSNSSFTIKEHEGLSIISPNGGEVWEYGSQHEIKWISNNISNTVTIALGVYDPVGSLVGYGIAVTDNDGSYIWTVDADWKSLDSLKCIVEISEYSDTISLRDHSDSYFTVVQNTSAGESVYVDLGNGTEITFDSVDSSGTTTLNVTQTGTPPPNSFTVLGSPNYYNIQTTSSFTGNVKININYSDSGLTEMEESNLRLNVFDTLLTKWVDITTIMDLENNNISGEVDHLSEFAILMPNSDSQVYTVTNTNDTGEGSFRKAIDDANKNGSPDKIKFNIPKADPNYDVSKGVWYIRPVTYFESLLDSGTVIDGTSQRIFIGEDTNTEGPEIVISGTNMSTNNGCLIIQGNKIEIYELTINNFNSAAVLIANSNNNVISGCYIGTDCTGMKSEENRSGIEMGPNVNGTLIGPSVFLDKPNVISGNSQNGIFIVENSKNNEIIGNYIGVNKNASDTIQNKLRGIDLSRGANNNTIMENFIGGNYQGIYISESSNNLVIANKIGTNDTWEYELSNSSGVLVFNNSSENIIRENIIGYNKGWGIKVSGVNSIRNTISQNFIADNIGLGIDNSDGGNLELSTPVIVSVSNTEISGTAGPNQVIEIFADSSNEGKEYLESTISDASGNFSVTLNSSLILPYITATATDDLGNTSEFSLPIIITNIDEIEKQIPTDYTLFQNYPNPFNPSTILSYQIPSSGHISLKIYDILGKEIKTLVNQKQQAGNYEISFDAKNLPSGVYFYQLKTKFNTMTKKMLLLE